MNRKALTAAFKLTIPVLIGYITIGVAFGLMLSSAGYGAAWAFLMSLTIFAGSSQFLGVELLHTGAALTQIALMVFLINFRHVVYGISMLEKFRGMGPQKAYMIFSLTDETYALLSAAEPPAGVSPKKYYFCVSALNQLYWVSGSVAGCAAGSLMRFNIPGIEFAMTAMFIVIAIEQWATAKNRLPAVIGAASALLALFLFGGGNMLLPALFPIVTLLLLLQGRFGDSATTKRTEGGEET